MVSLNHMARSCPKKTKQNEPRINHSHHHSYYFMFDCLGSLRIVTIVLYLYLMFCAPLVLGHVSQFTQIGEMSTFPLSESESLNVNFSSNIFNVLPLGFKFCSNKKKY